LEVLSATSRPEPGTICLSLSCTELRALRLNTKVNTVITEVVAISTGNSVKRKPSSDCRLCQFL
jgi:hypothetical protein